MKPTAPVANPLKGNLVDRIVPCHSVTGLSRGMAGAYFSNHGFGKFRTSLLLPLGRIGVRALPAKDLERVGLIFACRGKFEVLKAVVVSYSVKMINHLVGRDWAAKSLKNETVDLKGFYPVGPLAKAKNSISVLVSAPSDYFAGSAKKPPFARDSISRPARNIAPNLVSCFFFHTERLPVVSFGVNGNIQRGNGRTTRLHPC